MPPAPPPPLLGSTFQNVYLNTSLLYGDAKAARHAKPPVLVSIDVVGNCIRDLYRVYGSPGPARAETHTLTTELDRRRPLPGQGVGDEAVRCDGMTLPLIKGRAMCDWVRSTAGPY